MPQNPESQELIEHLSTMFYECIPDEEYLDDDEDTKEEIEHIEGMLNSEQTPDIEKIRALFHFNSEWFPDGLCESEQKVYQDLLDTAQRHINQTEQANPNS